MARIGDDLAVYKMMWLIRRFELQCEVMYRQQQIGGFCHLGIGQEAVMTGIVNAMDEKDSLITAYRAHGYCLAFGMSVIAALGELMGKAIGCSRGKGGSMHMFYKEKNFFGGHGIVGAHVPVGAGIALSNKLQNKNAVSIVCYGDGAANQGQVFETQNMAALWNLPVLFVIENNGYAMGTSQKRACAGGELYKRSKPFGINGEIIDGMDYHVIYNKISKILDKIKQTQQPYVIELNTYRYKGHSVSDPAKYRSREELNSVKQDRDPIEKLKQSLLKKNSLEKLQKIEKHVKEEITTAYQKCLDAPEPKLSEVYTDVVL